MSYTTMLYAVSIGELQSAFGSNNSGLLDRVRVDVQQSNGGTKRVDPTTGPRVRVTWKSEIYLNGKPVSPDELRHVLLNRDWEGTNLYLYQEMDPPPGQKREGEFKELGVFMRLLWTMMSSFDERGVICKKHYIGIESCATEEDFINLRNIDDDISEEHPRRTDRGQDHAAGQCLCLRLRTRTLVRNDWHFPRQRGDRPPPVAQAQNGFIEGAAAIETAED